MTSSQKNIFDSVDGMIAKGQGLSLLQKLQFELSINNRNELSNYIFILLILIEEPNYSAEASDLLLKKVLLDTKRYSFLNNDIHWIYEEMFANRILPYVKLSELIRRLLRTVIKNNEIEFDSINQMPDKAYLMDFNLKLLQDYLLKETNLGKAITLLYSCWSDLAEDDKVILNEKAIELFLRVLRSKPQMFDEYLRSFLRFYWYGSSRKWHEGKLIVPEPFYKQIFGSDRFFLDFLHQVKNRDHLSDDRIGLYNDIERFIDYYSKNANPIEYDDPKINLHLRYHTNLTLELSRK